MTKPIGVRLRTAGFVATDSIKIFDIVYYLQQLICRKHAYVIRQQKTKRLNLELNIDQVVLTLIRHRLSDILLLSEYNIFMKIKYTGYPNEKLSAFILKSKHYLKIYKRG